MTNIDWLFASPIAHRGLHNATKNIVENSLSAAYAAIAQGYAIECDVQLTKDGEAIVFHDFTLERLTNNQGAVIDYSTKDLCALTLLKSQDKVVTLQDFVAEIAGQTPLIIEIKSQFKGDLRLTHRVAELVGHKPKIAVKSFDPDCIAELKHIAPHIPRGVVGMSHYDCDEFAHISHDHKNDLKNLLHFRTTMPDFLSWDMNSLKQLSVILKKNEIEISILAWTIRSELERKMAEPYANQIIFEGFIA